MKKPNYLTKCLSAAFVLLLAGISLAQEMKNKKPRMLIVGTYHFTGNEEEITSEKRQKEVKALIRKLGTFAPTKIGVEVPADKFNEINEEYQRYRNGEYELGELETYQIGFRLAKALDHPRIYPIDWRNKFDLQPTLAFAGENGQMPLIQDGLLKMNRKEADLTVMVKTRSLTETLRFLNSNQAVEFVDKLMMGSLVRVGKGKDYVGTEVLAGWYERNLKIFTNIVRLIENEDDRLLVIIGAGHANLLSRFAKDSGLVQLEELGEYLR